MTFDRPSTTPYQAPPPIPSDCTLIPLDAPFSATPDPAKQDVLKKQAKKRRKGDELGHLFSGRIL